jgi:hypothetical protein
MKIIMYYKLFSKIKPGYFVFFRAHKVMDYPEVK